MTAIREIVTPARGLVCLTAGLPRAAGVSASPEAVALISHRDVLFSWPSPFYDPATFGPAVYSMPPRPDLAAQVDFILKPTSDRTAVPDGYVLDATSPGYERFRRTSAAPGPAAHCR